MNIFSQKHVARGTVLIRTEIFRSGDVMNRQTNIHNQINYIALPSWCFCEQSAALLRGVLTDS